MEKQTASYFQSLFQYIDKQYILVWLHDSDKRKESHWFTDAQEAAEFVENIRDQRINIRDQRINIYAGVGLSPKNYGPDRRCLKADIAGIPALWLDIDIKDPHHHKPNLPETVKDAMRLFESMEQQPTIIIHSGHGLQAYWVFSEPWIFQNNDERQQAMDLASRFIIYFKSAAAQYGWDVDSVQDLSRVLRVPGTTNWKGEPVPVKMLECNDLRYNPSDFDAILPALPAAALDRPTSGQLAQAGDLILAPGAEPPFAKFMALREIEPKFWQSYEHKRKDLQDQSASSYDLALANYAAMAGWSDQEIADLLISHRAKHSEDLKLRQDYYKRTIAIARKSADRFKADEVLVDMDLMPPEAQRGITEEQKEAIRQCVSSKFNIPGVRVIKFTAEQPQYRIETSLGAIDLGDIENLIAQGKLRNKLAAATGRHLPRFTPDSWDMIAQALLNIVEVQSLGDEAMDAGQARAWLKEYLDDAHVFSDPGQAVSGRDPFRDDGGVFLFGSSFQKWVRVCKFEKLTSQRLGLLLKKVGAQYCAAKNIKIDERWTTRSVWRVPDNEK